MAMELGPMITDEVACGLAAENTARTWGFGHGVTPLGFAGQT